MSAAARLGTLSREEISSDLDWHISRAGLELNIFAQAAAIDMLAEASESNPGTLSLLAQATWLEAARRNLLTIEPADIHEALRHVPAAHLKIHPPEPRAGCARRPHGLLVLSAFFARPDLNLRNPAQIVKETRQPPLFILPQSPTIIATGYNSHLQPVLASTAVFGFTDLKAIREWCSLFGVSSRRPAVLMCRSVRRFMAWRGLSMQLL